MEVTSSEFPSSCSATTSRTLARRRVSACGTPPAARPKGPDKPITPTWSLCSGCGCRFAEGLESPDRGRRTLGPARPRFQDGYCCSGITTRRRGQPRGQIWPGPRRQFTPTPRPAPAARPCSRAVFLISGGGLAWADHLALLVVGASGRDRWWRSGGLGDFLSCRFVRWSECWSGVVSFLARYSGALSVVCAGCGVSGVVEPCRAVSMYRAVQLLIGPGPWGSAGSRSIASVQQRPGVWLRMMPRVRIPLRAQRS